MKKTVTVEPYCEAKKKLNKLTLCVCLAGAVALLFNILFIVLRSDENHSIMLVLSIAVDVAASWFIIAFCDMKVAPLSRLLKLSKRQTQPYEGIIEAVKYETVRIEKFDCITLTVSGRNVFLPDVLVSEYEIGSEIKLSLAGMIATEVEYQ